MTDVHPISGRVPLALAALSEDLERAQRDAAESHADAPNSYGAGYDAGFVAGLLQCRQILLGETDAG